jgi:crossover junction endodeoxyribonuclease RuvC
LQLNKLPTSTNLYVGIDQSVTCTSFAFLKDGEIQLKTFKTDVRGPEHLSLLYHYACSAITHLGPPNGVAIEGYAYNAKGKYFNLGEVGGVLRLAAFQLKLPLIQVPPTTLKKFITGKGNSPKDILIKELYKKYGLDINDNNDADAAGLALLAYEFYETEFHCVKAYEHELHKTCDIIVGDHPKRLSYKTYTKDMPDSFKLSDWQKEWVKIHGR